MSTIKIIVYGEPKGQPRARAFSRGGHARVYDPGTADGWKLAVGCSAMQQIWTGMNENEMAHAFRAIQRKGAWTPAHPLYRSPVFEKDDPIRVDIKLFFKRPARLCRQKDREEPIPHIAKPDRDNSDKAILDALTGILWTDDCQVCAGMISKFYAEKSTNQPRAEITVTRLFQEMRA